MANSLYFTVIVFVISLGWNVKVFQNASLRLLGKLMIASRLRAISLVEGGVQLREFEADRNWDRFPAENPSLVLRISKDGAIVHANDAAVKCLDSVGLVQTSISQPIAPPENTDHKQSSLKAFG